MSRVVSVVGNRALPAADELDLAATVQEHFADARGRAGAVVVEYDDSPADGVLPQQHVPVR